MSTSLLELALSLLLSAAASVGQPPTTAPSSFVPATETVAQPMSESAVARREARTARISLSDPYYSFSRAKRAAAKD